MAHEILKWEPEGPALLTKVDSAGRTPLLLAISYEVLDVIDLFLDVPGSDELARISRNDGSYPVHIAAMVGSTTIIEKLVQKCPDYYEMVDAHGRNLLHRAVEYNQATVVRYICQNDTFSMLLNAVDYDGNTPLHLAAKHGFPRIVSILLQTMAVKTYIANKDGLTASALAIHASPPRWASYYILGPHYLTVFCLLWSKVFITLDGIHYQSEDKKSVEDKTSNEEDNLSKTGTIGSVLIATMAFTAAITVPGGFVSDDNPSAGSAILARRFAFRAFAVSDTLAFVCSATTTCFLILGGTREVPRNQRSQYKALASGLLPLAALLIVAAFAFGFHLVLGDANRGLIVLVYTACLATVLFGLPDIWVPWHLGLAKAVWRRARWRGLANIRKGSSSLLHQLFYHFPRSFLFMYLAGPLFVALVSATFVISIALNIALPNY
ncbi:unnamed protein product [Urochloa decumbens]|uniref:PGG domain-containing protein n=1 Tax=Urochloa decumbens TaxID=240449 RepID=A0ABC9BYJ1_9POAL